MPSSNSNKKGSGYTLSDLSKYYKEYNVFLNSDNVDILKEQLRASTITIMAIMDAVNVSEVAITRESLFKPEGSLEYLYDFDTDSYIVRRVK